MASKRSSFSLQLVGMNGHLPVRLGKWLRHPSPAIVTRLLPLKASTLICNSSSSNPQSNKLVVLLNRAACTMQSIGKLVITQRDVEELDVGCLWKPIESRHNLPRMSRSPGPWEGTWTTSL